MQSPEFGAIGEQDDLCQCHRASGLTLGCPQRPASDESLHSPSQGLPWGGAHRRHSSSPEISLPRRSMRRPAELSVVCGAGVYSTAGGRPSIRARLHQFIPQVRSAMSVSSGDLPGALPTMVAHSLFFSPLTFARWLTVQKMKGYRPRLGLIGERCPLMNEEDARH